MVEVAHTHTSSLAPSHPTPPTMHPTCLGSSLHHVSSSLVAVANLCPMLAFPVCSLAQVSCLKHSPPSPLILSPSTFQPSCYALVSMHRLRLLPPAVVPGFPPASRLAAPSQWPAGTCESSPVLSATFRELLAPFGSSPLHRLPQGSLCKPSSCILGCGELTGSNFSSLLLSWASPPEPQVRSWCAYGTRICPAV